MREIEQLNKRFRDESAQDILEYFLSRYRDKIVLSTSFGAEDQVLTDMALNIDQNLEIFTLDTGRLSESTYRVWSKSQLRYGVKIEPFVPDRAELEGLIESDGVYGFYDSIQKRKECCRVRKIEPLKRALKGRQVWITGVRREQSPTRSDMAIVEYDSTFDLIKINPLLEWSTDMIWSYIKEHNTPYNELHDIGYPSIGCEPCTRAVKSGEDIRAGRWWWEEPEHKECGLHSRSSR